MAKGTRNGKRNSNNGIKYTSADKTTYESKDEVLYLDRLTKSWGIYDHIYEAGSDGNGNIRLYYAEPDSYYEKSKNKSYAMYELRTGITDMGDSNNGFFGDSRDNEKSKFKDENYIGRIRSVGINWDNVKSVSGQTYDVKSFLKEKGFKWDGESKSWKKQ